MGTVGSNVDSAVSKMEDQLWSAKLNEAAAGAAVTGQEAKIDAKKKLDELRSKLTTTQSKLDEAKAAGGDKWDSFKAGVGNSWRELEEAFKELTR